MLFKGLKNQNEINKKMKSRISSENNSRFSKVCLYFKRISAFCCWKNNKVLKNNELFFSAWQSIRLPLLSQILSNIL